MGSEMCIRDRYAVGVKDYAAAFRECVEGVAREVACDAAGLQRAVKKENEGRPRCDRVGQHLRETALNIVDLSRTAVHYHAV